MLVTSISEICWRLAKHLSSLRCFLLDRILTAGIKVPSLGSDVDAACLVVVSSLCLGFVVNRGDDFYYAKRVSFCMPLHFSNISFTIVSANNNAMARTTTKRKSESKISTFPLLVWSTFAFTGFPRVTSHWQLQALCQRGKVSDARPQQAGDSIPNQASEMMILAIRSSSTNSLLLPNTPKEQHRSHESPNPSCVWPEMMSMRKTKDVFKARQ